jgi:hypothetical protein
VIRLFEGSGSSEIQLLDQSIPTLEWERLKNVAARLLERRGDCEAADLLRKHSFIVHKGTNGFGDEFDVLYMRSPMATYVELAETAEDQQLRWQWRTVAEAVGEVVSKHIRFVAVDLETTDELEPVTSPVLEITSDVVERALHDAEQLLATQGATSGVDRIHTAFHGYLLAVAARAAVTVSDNASVTELFKAIRQGHPSFKRSGPRQGDIDKVMRSFATVVDALNPVRNQASVAHPNEDLLEEPEAMLVINSVRSLLHYLNARIRM